ncbi:kinase binding protein CGI-121-domain-containing protein [Xylariales sp. PMI_506]|nr:kinase binding protein CGI-121-domain-containing protein [Xylariales sp. PMI_506]
MLETIALEHVPATHTVHVALFRDVANASFLHEQLLARNADFEYALIDASTVISRFHLLSAVYKAITIELAGSMKTPNVHSEIVCSLSSNNNISEAYRRYGIQPTTRNVVVVRVLVAPSSGSPDQPAKTAVTTPEDVEKHLTANVQGEQVPVTDEALASLTDWAKLRKYHKLNGLPHLDAIKDEDARKKELELLVVSAMALRGL